MNRLPQVLFKLTLVHRDNFRDAGADNTKS